MWVYDVSPIWARLGQIIARNQTRVDNRVASRAASIKIWPWLRRPVLRKTDYQQFSWARAVSSSQGTSK